MGNKQGQTWSFYLLVNLPQSSQDDLFFGTEGVQELKNMSFCVVATSVSLIGIVEHGIFLQPLPYSRKDFKTILLFLMVFRILIYQGKQKKAYGTDATLVSVAGQKAAQSEGTVPHNYACFFFTTGWTKIHYLIARKLHLSFSRTVHI